LVRMTSGPSYFDTVKPFESINLIFVNGLVGLVLGAFLKPEIDQLEADVPDTKPENSIVIC